MVAGGYRVRAPLWRPPRAEIVRLAQFELEGDERRHGMLLAMHQCWF